jgi:hypothetical protein
MAKPGREGERTSSHWLQGAQRNRSAGMCEAQSGDSAGARPPAEHAVYHSGLKLKGVAGGVAIAHTTRHVFLQFFFLSLSSFLFLLISYCFLLVLLGFLFFEEEEEHVGEEEGDGEASEGDLIVASSVDADAIAHLAAPVEVEQKADKRLDNGVATRDEKVCEGSSSCLSAQMIHFDGKAKAKQLCGREKTHQKE